MLRLLWSRLRHLLEADRSRPKTGRWPGITDLAVADILRLEWMPPDDRFRGHEDAISDCQRWEQIILLEQLVTPPDPPKLIYSLAFETLIFGSLVVVAGIWLGALGNGMGIVSVCGACVLMLLKIRSVSTRVTEVGVSQLTLRGRVHLSWHEVTQVTRAPLSLTLVGTNRRVVVSLEEFADSAAVISYVESHIPSNLPSD